jgi:rhodanese-related sulfurtransferase
MRRQPKYRVLATFQGRLFMPSPNSISIEKLVRLLGRPDSPALIDVRTDEDFDANPHLIPGSLRRPWAAVAEWGPALVATKRPAVVICHKGLKLSQGVAAWLRHGGGVADILEDGFIKWQHGKLPLVPAAKLPKRDARGRTVWVTRARPKIDRIACPWLIRRFVDPEAVFLFVAPAEVLNVAERFDATPFDIDHESVHWSHRGERCTFDLMVEEFGIATEPLKRLAQIVRGADTGHPEIAPESAGLLAASLGLSRMYADDLEQLEAGLTLYDAFYRWCRDAVNEGHDWPPTVKKS